MQTNQHLWNYLERLEAMIHILLLESGANIEEYEYVDLKTDLAIGERSTDRVLEVLTDE